MDEMHGCCEHCRFWKKLEGQTERPYWGSLYRNSGNTFVRHIRPVPERLETVGPFSCGAFNLSMSAVRKASEE
jgi:hypothetical protein